MRRRLMRAGVGATVVALAAVTVPTAPTQAEPSKGSGQAAWTMMVFLDADNNLEATGLVDLQEMAEAAGPGVNFLVLIDRNQKDYSGPPELGLPDGPVLGLDTFSDAKLLKLNGGNDIEVLEELGELNLMDPQNLAWFVWYGLTNYPAEHNGLVFWDHGGAALIPFGEDEDNDKADFYTIPELQTALGSALSKAGSDKLDLIGFDTCLDAAVEVVRAMAPYGQYFVSSEEVVAGHGWDYTSLAVARGGADVTGLDVANAVIGSYQGHSSSPPLGGEQDYTMSVVDLSAVEQLDSALAGFVDAVEADPATGVALLQARQQAIEFGVMGPDPAANFHVVDLGDMLARLPAGLPDSVLVARNALYAALDRAVLDNLNGPAHEGAQGLSIYLPSSGAYYDSLYEDHPDPTGWRDLVKGILTGATAPPGGGGGAPATSGDLALNAQAAGWTATMQLGEGVAASLAGALGVYGVPAADGTAAALAILPATLGAGGPDQIQTAWSYQFVRLDGQPVTAAIEPMAEGFKASVQGIYVDPTGAQIPATLAMDLILAGGGLSFGNVELLDTSNGVGAIYPQEGSQFAPILSSVSGSQIVGDELLAPIDPLDFGVEVDELPGGNRFYASIIAFLPDGTDAVQSAVGTRP